MCKACYASDDAPRVIFPSNVGGYNMPGIMFGIDQKDSNSSADQAFGVGVMLSGPLKSSLKNEPLRTVSTQTTTGPVEKSKFRVLGGAWSQA